MDLLEMTGVLEQLETELSLRWLFAAYSSGSSWYCVTAFDLHS